MLVRMLFVWIAAVLFAGCSITQQGAIEELAPIYQKQFEAAAHARAEAVKEVMAALKEIKRGGMEVELDENGRVKKISYREHLDEEMLRRALSTVKPNMPVPHAPAQDYAALFMGIGSIATPLASMYFNFRSHEISSDNAAMVELNRNQMQNFNWDMFTGRYKNQSPAWPPEYMMPKEEPEGGEK